MSAALAPTPQRSYRVTPPFLARLAMREEKTTVFDLERQISVVAVRLKQQQRIVESLGEGLDRLQALSVYADLLRAEYELESHRARLKQKLSVYSFSTQLTQQDRR